MFLHMHTDMVAYMSINFTILDTFDNFFYFFKKESRQIVFILDETKISDNNCQKEKSGS